MSEKSGYEAGIGTRQTGKTELSKPRDLAGPALVTNSLCRGQERHTMHQKSSQIGNPDLIDRDSILGSRSTARR